MAFRCFYCAHLSVESLVGLAETEFTAGSFPQRAFYQHHASLDDLEDAASKSCALCRLILGYLQGTHDSDDGLPLYTRAKQLPFTSVKVAINSTHVYATEPLDRVQVFDALMVHIGPWMQPGRDATDEEIDAYYDQARLPTLEFNVVDSVAYKKKDIPSKVSRYKVGRHPVNRDLTSPTNFAIAKQWLHECQHTHRCLSDTIQELPTRVIDVGLSQDAQPISPRLICSQGKRAEYVALSHCWGGKIAPVLTCDNIETFRVILPVGSLPNNFRDAITITRRLGIRYLWIDSLCILQDSKEDWEVESKRMYLVYRNATVTISASASKASTNGILINDPTSALRLEPVNLKLVSDTSSKDRVKIEPREDDEETLRSLDIWGPLSKRGWTLQESILGPRQLIYGKCHIYWRCPRGFQASDGLPAGSRTPHWDLSTVSSVLYGELLLLPSPPTFDTERALIEYYDLVENYSHRQLTYASDKFPAFSGLAQGLYPAINGSYLAGHWSSDFARGLLWYPDLECKHVQPYRAPSWSWAVTDGPIVYVKDPFKSNKWTLQLLSHDITSKDIGNRYGEVVSGHVVVKGLTKPFIRSKQLISGPIERYHRGSCLFDEYDTLSISKYLYRLGEENNDDFILSLSRQTGPPQEWEVDYELFESEVYLALLVQVPESFDGKRVASEAKGLVLRKVFEGDEEVYERVGYMELNPPKLSWLQSWTSRTLKIV